MRLIHRIAHLLSCLMAAVPAYIYQIVTRYHLKQRFNMSHASNISLVSVVRLGGAFHQHLIPHLVNGGGGGVGNLSVATPEVRKAYFLPVTATQVASLLDDKH